MMFEKIKKWYDQGLWSAEMVLAAVRKGMLNQEQADTILWEDYK